MNPCQPSPCGPNSNCREVNEQAVCSCRSEFEGAPPNCRPQCTSSSECASNRACINQKCVDPCPGVCGQQAICEVRNHSPICRCPTAMIGDPFVRCVLRPTSKKKKMSGVYTIKPNNLYPMPVAPPPLRDIAPYRDPCLPSPCGLYASCRNQQNQAVCSCLPNYFGTPPHCRPECSINAECPSHLACIGERCRDPCPGACGQQTECRVISHVPSCVCLRGYVGDAFLACHPAPRKSFQCIIPYVGLRPRPFCSPTIP